MAAQFPPDDVSITDDEWLYVRIFPSQGSIQRTDDGAGWRPSSGSLRRHDQALSVDLGSHCTPQETRDRDLSQTFHVARVAARVVRACGCRIIRDPEAGNPSHALVYGNHSNGDGSLSKSQTKHVARAAGIVLLSAGFEQVD